MCNKKSRGWVWGLNLSVVFYIWDGSVSKHTRFFQILRMLLNCKKDGVNYKISCERLLYKRIKEHDRDVRLSWTQTLAVSVHANKAGCWHFHFFLGIGPEKSNRTTLRSTAGILSLMTRNAMNVQLICLGMNEWVRRFRVHAIAEFYQDLCGAIQWKHYTIMKAQIMLSDC